MKRLILKIAVKVIIFATIAAILMAVEESAVIKNDIAIGQLENSDAEYILMQMTQNLSSVVNILYIVFSGLLLWGVFSDIYKFIKTRCSKEETKE